MGTEVSADERVQRKGLLAEDLIAYLSLILLIHIVEHLNLVYQYGHCFVPKVRLFHDNCFSSRSYQFLHAYFFEFSATGCFMTGPAKCASFINESVFLRNRSID
jgi:hypothetical protein